MTTFSQLIDELVVETRRPDLRTEIAVYLNQTIREVHFEPSRGNVVHYPSNRREDQITASVAQGQSWEIPNVSSFQGLEVVRFASQYLGRLEYAKEVSPGPNIATVPFYWYRAGSMVFFGGSVGYGGVGGVIQLAWYEYPRAMKYKIQADREATYDVDDGWTYRNDYDTNDTQRAIARERVTNWLLMRWADVLREGLRAKIYKRLGDDVRQRTSYSLYQQLRQGLFTSEVAVLSGA